MLSINKIAGTRKVFINHLDKMKPIPFISFLKRLETQSNSVISRLEYKITEKIDGSALRIGLDCAHVPFIESATSPPISSVGAFEARDKSRGYDGLIGCKFDMLLSMIQGDKLLQEVLYKFSEDGIKIIGEVLFPPLAKSTCCDHILYIRTPYEKIKLGYDFTFVPLKVLNGHGERHAKEDSVMDACYKISTRERMYINPVAQLKSDICLSREISAANMYIGNYSNSLKILTSRKKVDRDRKTEITGGLKIFQEMIRDKILDTVRYGIFGQHIEGLVIESDDIILKVTSNHFRNTPPS